MMPTGSLPRYLASKTGSFVISHRVVGCSCCVGMMLDLFACEDSFFRVLPPPCDRCTSLHVSCIALCAVHRAYCMPSHHTPMPRIIMKNHDELMST